MRERQELVTKYAVLKMGSSELGVLGELAQKHAPPREVVLGNSVEQEHAHLPHVVASLVLLLIFCRKESAMALTLLLVGLMGFGGHGANGLRAFYQWESALGQRSVRGNVTTQNLSMVGGTAKEVEEEFKLTVAQFKRNVLWIVSAQSGGNGSPAPSHVKIAVLKCA